MQRNQKRNILNLKFAKPQSNLVNPCQNLLFSWAIINLFLMSSGSAARKLLNEQVIAFFPKEKSARHHRKSTLQSSEQKLPYLFNKIHHNTIETQRKLRRHKRSLSTYDITDFQSSQLRRQGKLNQYLSSKVDFFNQQNERRLKLKKRKIMIDLGAIRCEKEKLIPTNKIGKVSPAMVQLVRDYLLKRSAIERQGDQYYVLGKDV